ncbi:MAG: cyclopropane fatty acyl phospholipid synthase [Bacteroidales bacterium]|nr:cyclopropane fatty acyl phospholipid synthase [Bacteroidales bacterium]
MRAQKIIEDLLSYAGITLNGDQPFDIRVHNNKLYALLLGNPELAIGESYMDGWWNCDDLDEFINRILRARIKEKVSRKINTLLPIIKARIFNLQNRILSKQVIYRHYDLGNDLFEAMLDKRLAYSCGYWKDADNLDAAQEAKLDLICRKLNLKEGMTLLDIGCGWGSLAGYAAEKYGVRVTGYNISEEQVKYARERYKDLPVDIRLEDYRDAKGQFDAVVSVGFFEHVGYKNYRNYMKVTHRCLKDNGIALLHTISNDISTHYQNPWTDKYIFPNGIIPSVAWIAKSVEGLFTIEDVENIGPYYDPTLTAWYHNFDKSWPALRKKYGDRFYRMWRYYLLSCAGGFRARLNQVTQYVLTKTGRSQPDIPVQH